MKRTKLWLWLTLGLTVASVGLTPSCHTFEAVTQAPPEFWMTLEKLFLGVVEDIASIVDLLL